jgi:hypothetical protein
LMNTYQCRRPEDILFPWLPNPAKPELTIDD